MVPSASSPLVLLDDFPDSPNHILDIRFRHLRVDREGNDPVKNGAGIGEVLGAVPEGVPVIGMQMQGNKMDAGADVVLLEQIDEFVAADAQPLQVQLDDIEMPGVLPLYGHQRGGDFRDVPESLVVQGGIPLPDLPKAITLFELLNPNGCRYIRQVVLVARGENLVVPRSFGGIAL